jgi:hypothetical protein
MHVFLMGPGTHPTKKKKSDMDQQMKAVAVGYAGSKGWPEWGGGGQRSVKMGKGSQIYEIGYHRRAGRGGGYVGV